jgi:hypothetical protein
VPRQLVKAVVCADVELAALIVDSYDVAWLKQAYADI